MKETVDQEDQVTEFMLLPWLPCYLICSYLTALVFSIPVNDSANLTQILGHCLMKAFNYGMSKVEE